MQECPECGKQFENKIGVKVHHSKKHDGTLANPIVECENCGKEKRTTSYRARINEHHFCDAECKGEWQSENHTKEDHPRWNRESYVCEVCGDEYKVPLHKKENTKWCSEECQIQGLANRAARRTGSDHPTWKGGSSAYHGVRRCLAERGWEYIADVPNVSAAASPTSTPRYATASVNATSSDSKTKPSRTHSTGANSGSRRTTTKSNSSGRG